MRTTDYVKGKSNKMDTSITTTDTTTVPPFYVDWLLGDPGKKEEEEVLGFSREGLQRATRG